MSLTVFFILAIMASATENVLAQEEAGCYKDKDNDEALSTLLFTDKDPTSANFSGTLIDQDNHDSYLLDLNTRCREKAIAAKIYKYYGLTNYGECWAGTNSDADYTRHGSTKQYVSDSSEENKTGKCNVTCVYGIQTCNSVYGDNSRCMDAGPDCSMAGGVAEFEIYECEFVCCRL